MSSNTASQYVYIVKTREAIRANDNVYKIGRTTQENHRRLNSYPNGSILIYQSETSDCSLTERLIKQMCKELFKQRLDYGVEYFEVDNKRNLINCIHHCISIVENDDQVSTYMNHLIKTRLISSNDVNDNINKEVSNAICDTHKLADLVSRLDNKISEITSYCINEPVTSQVPQDKPSSELYDVYKGRVLCNVISDIYSTSEIINTDDIVLLERDDKQNILFQNMVYPYNVPQHDVMTFHKNTQKFKCNGILLSQSSGIIGKPNFHVEVNNRNIMLYIHRVEYSRDLIKLGVDVIDTISEFINKELDNDTVSIDYSILDVINREVASFVTKKKDIIDFVKEQQRHLLHKLDEMSISNTLLTLLNQYFGPSAIHNNEYNCNICNKFSGHNIASLSAHRRRCKDE
jgi:hypothetical protein